MNERSIRVSVNGPAGVLGRFSGGVAEALIAAVRQAVGDGELTLIEIQVRVLEPSLADVTAVALTAQCLRAATSYASAAKSRTPRATSSRWQRRRLRTPHELVSSAPPRLKTASGAQRGRG